MIYFFKHLILIIKFKKNSIQLSFTAELWGTTQTMQILFMQHLAMLGNSTYFHLYLNT